MNIQEISLAICQRNADLIEKSAGCECIGPKMVEAMLSEALAESTPELLTALLKCTAALQIALANYASKDSEQHGRLLAIRLECEALAAATGRGK